MVRLAIESGPWRDTVLRYAAGVAIAGVCIAGPALDRRAAAEPAAPTSSPAVAAGLSWRTERAWDDARTQARTDDRLLLIDFYATWCGPCKLLDRQVYPQPEVAAEIADFVRVKVDVDTPRGEKLATAYRVFSMPTVLVCTPTGEEIDRIRGYRPPAEFLELIRKYRSGRGTLGALRLELAHSAGDPALRLEVGRKLAERLEVDAARRCLRAVAGDSSAGDDRFWALVTLADLESRAGSADSAVALMRRAGREFPQSIGTEHTLRTIARYQDRAGDGLAALATCRDLMARAPSDPRALDEFARRAADLGVALDEAEYAAERAVELSGREARYMSTLAHVHRIQGRYPEAMKWARRAAARAPEDPAYREQLEAIRREAIGG